MFDRNASAKNKLQRHLLAMAIGTAVGVASLGTPVALAANSDGAIVGTLETTEAAVSGVEVTIRNKDNGLTRTAKADSKGRYRFSRLPVGNYEVFIVVDGEPQVLAPNVRVTIGTTTEVAEDQGEIEEVAVIGQRGRLQIDTATSESGVTFSAADLEMLPVGRSLESVALMAPGTVSGTAFGGVSFGGSSVGENAVFINGLNVSDVETGVSAGSVPFSFLEEAQIKTGGYSVEFGRTTGGVTNAVVKSGTNEFKYGFSTYYEPAALRGGGTDGYNANGERVSSNKLADSDDFSTSFYASGPLIQDKLFYYVVYEPRNNRSEGHTLNGGTTWETKDDSAFWGGKVDWLITDDHALELIAFSDERESVTDNYDDGEYLQTAFVERGGKNYLATYTGQVTDNFLIKAMYGESEGNYDASDTSGFECAYVYDNRVDEQLGCTTSRQFDARDNGREAFRLDMEYALGDHLLRFGMDDEVRTTVMNRLTTGPDQQYYQIYDATPGDAVNGGTVAGDAYVIAWTKNSTGEFEAETSAFYLEDVWSVTSNITATLGVRFDEFDTKDAGGNSFLKVDDMISPRFGVAWDINGDGSSKLFANLGRYYFPLANGLVAREGGGSLDLRTYHELEGFTSETTASGYTNVTPILGAQIGDVYQVGNSTAGLSGAEAVVDNDLEASYQDELILGYEKLVAESWKLGVRGIARRFENAIEDMKINVDVAGCGNISGWVFANPGRELTLTRECDDGQTRQISIDLAKNQMPGLDGQPLGGPVPERSYNAIELILDRQFADRWSFNTSYTWSRSYGNYEGGVNSDTGNDIPGWTEAGDNVAYLLGNYGRLPNDRTHSLKMRGIYALTDSLSLSASFSMISGRPINARAQGNPFTDSESYDFNYVCVENCSGDYTNAERTFARLNKGQYGDLDWINTLDLGAAYRTQVAGRDVSLRADIFNVLNSQSVTDVDEILRYTMATNSDDFLSPTAFQTPRSVRLSASVDF
ncbi:TonB-dependent receptor [Microbulbifer harenosus]|uniref:TonB-dependent receptor n=1 Tax=Microbulbifer harenosus TaxID=2576840 RepID=A0ABY2UJH2_9GAMM|nr:carboxypeptidase regulatory-like domain-containing protein [Microbulbifer harenosus]TLM78349.1 TonB-dependent receptor [Microbulbifer harenosus]